jgi:hypothetical protein
MSSDQNPNTSSSKTLKWVAIGCGAVIVVGVIIAVVVSLFVVQKVKDAADDFAENPAKTAAEMAVRLDPNIELVESDDEAGTITFRDVRTGRETTVNFEEIAEGKISVKDDEGEFSIETSESGSEGEAGGLTVTGPDGEIRYGATASLDDVPEWVPIYANATEVQGAYSSTSDKGTSGLVTSKTADGVDEVLAYYKNKLEQGGFTITGENKASTQGGVLGSIAAEHEGTGRAVNIGIVEQQEETQITVNYSEKLN